jgi:hypothetical protein
VRTTLTLDDDLARRLKESSRRSDRPFKTVVNDALRAGLKVLESPPPAKRYRLEPVHLGGVRPGIDLDHALRLADELEERSLRDKLDQRV